MNPRGASITDGRRMADDDRQRTLTCSAGPRRPALLLSPLPGRQPQADEFAAQRRHRSDEISALARETNIATTIGGTRSALTAANHALTLQPARAM